jgi:hypothetical protein
MAVCEGVLASSNWQMADVDHLLDQLLIEHLLLL